MRPWLVGAIALAGCNFSPSDGAVDGSPIGGEAAAIDTPLPDCLGAACRKRSIKIDHLKVLGGPHMQFPLYVDITDPDFANAAPTGFDFAFTVDGATKLPHERESFDGDRLRAWVAVPSLPSTTDTTINLYYGDELAADDPQQPAAVWDAGYQAVWHLSQTAGALADSTAHANAGTPEGGIVLGVEGSLGTAARFDGIDSRIHVAASTALDSTKMVATLGVWVNFDRANSLTGEFQRLLLHTNSFGGNNRGGEWANDPSGNHFYYPSDAASSNYNLVDRPFLDATWHHVVLTQDFSSKTVDMYIDGKLAAFSMELVDTNWVNLATYGDWFWGGRPPRNQFAGMIDEIRVSNVVRSGDWIATEHANQASPSTFYAVE